jgi:hypothetical protein
MPPKFGNGGPNGGRAAAGEVGKEGGQVGVHHVAGDPYHQHSSFTIYRERQSGPCEQIEVLLGYVCGRSENRRVVVDPERVDQPGERASRTWLGEQRYSGPTHQHAGVTQRSSSGSQQFIRLEKITDSGEGGSSHLRDRVGADHLQ